MTGVAELILNDFDRYLSRFNELTARAKQHFEKGDWEAAREDAALRLALYAERNTATLERLGERLDTRIDARETWHQYRADYRMLLEGRSNHELAETWFNSLTRKVFTTMGVDKDVEFVDRDFGRPSVGEGALDPLTFAVNAGVAEAVQSGVEAVGFDVPFASVTADAAAVESQSSWAGKRRFTSRCCPRRSSASRVPT